MVTKIYKIRSEIWVAPSLRNLATQKHQNFGTQQDIINCKMVLQTTDTPAQANLIRCTSGPHTAKNRTRVLTHPTGSHQAVHCHASNWMGGWVSG